MPFVEKGSIILIGATTENPSFEINGALLSRCKVFVLKALTVEDLLSLLRRALTDPRGFGVQKIEISDDLLEIIARFANGDARTALSTLEMAVLNGGTGSCRHCHGHKGNAGAVHHPRNPCSTTKTGRSTTT